MSIAWGDDPPGSEGQIKTNIRQLLARTYDDADQRVAPTVAMAQQWHRDIYAGIQLPVPYYAGELRDSNAAFPELVGYEVRVGAHYGVPSDQVPAQLAAFEAEIQKLTKHLDRLFPPRTPPKTLDHLQDVLWVAAVAHGEWVRIHPFANGNGRTARMWVTWFAARYGLPAYMSVKPRPPGSEYASASAASMTNDHVPMTTYLINRLLEFARINP